MKIKIFDCSNSSKRPKHRGNGGPKENDIIHYLKKYSSDYNAKFVNDINEANVVITNDVFTEEVLNSDLPLVKRMDGVYWHKDYIDRNVLLNEAARQADEVIFISKYSEKSYFELYGDKLKNHTVTINISEPIGINKKEYKSFPKKWISIANDWERKEKRLEDTLLFSEFVEEVILVGKMPSNMKLPKNVKSVGYIPSKEELYTLISSCDSMISFSYKDACPKTVAHGVECGLPILYSQTGGTEEMIKYGVPFVEEDFISFGKCIPLMDKKYIKERLNLFNKNYLSYIKEIKNKDSNKDFKSMLEHYFLVLERASLIQKKTNK